MLFENVQYQQLIFTSNNLWKQCKEKTKFYYLIIYSHTQQDRCMMEKI